MGRDNDKIIDEARDFTKKEFLAVVISYAGKNDIENKFLNDNPEIKSKTTKDSTWVVKDEDKKLIAYDLGKDPYTNPIHLEKATKVEASPEQSKKYIEALKTVEEAYPPFQEKLNKFLATKGIGKVDENVAFEKNADHRGLVINSQLINEAMQIAETPAAKKLLEVSKDIGIKPILDKLDNKTALHTPAKSQGTVVGKGH